MNDANPPLHELKLHHEKDNSESTARPALGSRAGSAASVRTAGSRAARIHVEGDGGSPASRSASPFASRDAARAAGSTSSLSAARQRTPMNSMLELKRFFGKGRKKHEHGVSHAAAARAPPVPSGHPSPVVSLAGSPAASPAPSGGLPAHGSGPLAHDKKHHSLSSIFGFHKHHHKKDGKDVKDGKEKEHALPPAALQHAPARDFGDLDHPVVLGKPPADLDPNFVVHGPDYEADWDPFHVFGLEPNSERLPFLESGITKYGQIGRDMGSGAGGSVRMMERPSDHKLFAVKEFRKRRGNESLQKYAKTMTAEYALGAALHHKNIIETIDLIKEGDKYYEVMEYGSHDFFELVMSGEMSTAQVNSAFRQIVDGVAYLHSMGVAHRDIKLDNCVVTDDGVVKLIDFGSAVIFRYPISPKIHLARGILGSDPYLAPEVFERRPYQPQCADIWSCGIIYCCEYLRRFPWKLPRPEDASYRKFAENPANVDGEHPHQENARKITGPWRVLRLLPRDSRQIIGRILTISVSERATMEEIYADPWFKEIKTISVLPTREED